MSSVVPPITNSTKWSSMIELPSIVLQSQVGDGQLGRSKNSQGDSDSDETNALIMIFN